MLSWRKTLLCITKNLRRLNEYRIFSYAVKKPSKRLSILFRLKLPNLIFFISHIIYLDNKVFYYIENICGFVARITYAIDNFSARLSSVNAIRVSEK